MAQGEALATLTRKMLNSDFPNERRLAIDALLKATGVSELSPLIMQWGSVPPPTMENRGQNQSTEVSTKRRF